MTRGALYVLFTASGFAGLIYESIWTQYLKLFLGHAAYAQSLVLAVFMGGMAAGAAWCGRRAAGEALAMLYFTNSLGAAAGVLVSGFLLIAALGLPGTLRVAGEMNLVIAVVVALLARPVHDRPLAVASERARGVGLLLAVAF